MHYEVLNRFIATEHNHHLYEKGDLYPKTGYKEETDRVAFLQEIHPNYKRAFLGKEMDEKYLPRLSTTELKKIKNEDLRAYLDHHNIEYSSENNKEALIALVKGKA